MVVGIDPAGTTSLRDRSRAKHQRKNTSMGQSYTVGRLIYNFRVMNWSEIAESLFRSIGISASPAAIQPSNRQSTTNYAPSSNPRQSRSKKLSRDRQSDGRTHRIPHDLVPFNSHLEFPTIVNQQLKLICQSILNRRLCDKPHSPKNAAYNKMRIDLTSNSLISHNEYSARCDLDS